MRMQQEDKVGIMLFVWLVLLVLFVLTYKDFNPEEPFMAVEEAEVFILDD